jgi:hypothetical protein
MTRQLQASIDAINWCDKPVQITFPYLIASLIADSLMCVKFQWIGARGRVNHRWISGKPNYTVGASVRRGSSTLLRSAFLTISRIPVAINSSVSRQPQWMWMLSRSSINFLHIPRIIYLWRSVVDDNRTWMSIETSLRRELLMRALVDGCGFASIKNQ